MRRLRLPAVSRTWLYAWCGLIGVSCDWTGHFSENKLAVTIINP